MQVIVSKMIDFIIYNWKEATTTALLQAKDQFYNSYLATKDTFLTSYVFLLALKCALSVIIATFLFLLDYRRIRTRSELMDCFLCIAP